MLFHPVYFGLYWIQKLEILTVSFKNIQWCGGSAPFPDYKNRVSKCLKYSFKSNDMNQWVNVKLNQSTYNYIKLYIGYFNNRIPVWDFHFLKFTFKNSLSTIYSLKFTFKNSLYKIHFLKFTFWNLFLEIHFLRDLFKVKLKTIRS